VEEGGASLYVVLNAAPQTIEFMLPILPPYSRWTPCLDTSSQSRLGAELTSGAKAHAQPRSILVFSGSP
jgi:isoamylase